MDCSHSITDMKPSVTDGFQCATDCFPSVTDCCQCVADMKPSMSDCSQSEVYFPGFWTGQRTTMRRWRRRM